MVILILQQIILIRQHYAIHDIFACGLQRLVTLPLTWNRTGVSNVHRGITKYILWNIIIKPRTGLRRHRDAEARDHTRGHLSTRPTITTTTIDRRQPRYRDSTTPTPSKYQTACRVPVASPPLPCIRVPVLLIILYSHLAHAVILC